MNTPTIPESWAPFLSGDEFFYAWAVRNLTINKKGDESVSAGRVAAEMEHLTGRPITLQNVYELTAKLMSDSARSIQCAEWENADAVDGKPAVRASGILLTAGGQAALEAIFKANHIDPEQPLHTQGAVKPFASLLRQTVGSDAGPKR